MPDPRKARIAVLVSGGGTNLQALLDAEKRGEIPHGEIVLVVSGNPAAYALERAKAAGVKSAAFSKKQLGGQEAFERAILAALEEEKIDLVILAGFLSILSADFTKRYERRMHNVHPSLIPAFSGEGFYGLRVHEAALARGVRSRARRCISSTRSPTEGRSSCRKPWRWRRGLPPRSCRSASCGRPNGSFCPGRRSWFQRKSSIVKSDKENRERKEREWISTRSRRWKSG